MSMTYVVAGFAVGLLVGMTGLGLAIVRDIATLHGASIALGESSHGSGLTVTVRFDAPVIVEASSALKAN